MTTLLVTVALGLLALLASAARDERDLAFTIGVRPTIPAAKLVPGATVCQSGITVPDPFTRVLLRAGSPAGPGQPLDLRVLEVGSNRQLAHGHLPGGYPNPTEESARVGRVAAGQRIAVCIRNAGEERVLLYGNTAAAALPSEARINARRLPTDLALVFLTDERHSLVAQLPTLFERASVFRPGWVGPWVFWLLMALTVIAVPLLLARALADSSDAPSAPPAGPARPD